MACNEKVNRMYISSLTLVGEVFLADYNDYYEGFKEFVNTLKEIAENLPLVPIKKRNSMYKKHKREGDSKKVTFMKNKFYKKLKFKGIETVNTYGFFFSVFQRYLNSKGDGSILKANLFKVCEFLNEISLFYNKNTLKKYRQALQWYLRSCDKLPMDVTLKLEVEARDVKNQPRAYTQEQFDKLLAHCAPAERITLILCFYSGLRARELLTIQPGDMRKESDRVASQWKFFGIDGALYTVHGKGGLIRLIRLPWKYVDELEKMRLETPKRVKNRGIIFWSHYDILGGTKLSSWFTKFSREVLGFSHGVHGLRHSYAQNRFITLMKASSDIKNVGLDHKEVQRVVSQELGHFRPEITKVYLRGMLTQLIMSQLNARL